MEPAPRGETVLDRPQWQADAANKTHRSTTDLDARL
jgi:hypothetical protein